MLLQTCSITNLVSWLSKTAKSIFIFLFFSFPFFNLLLFGDFQGCRRVGNQRQVNGGQQKSSAGWLDCSTRRHALQKMLVWDWHLCVQEQRAHDWHITCSTRRHALQKKSVWDILLCTLLVLQSHAKSCALCSCASHSRYLEVKIRTNKYFYYNIKENYVMTWQNG